MSKPRGLASKLRGLAKGLRIREVTEVHILPTCMHDLKQCLKTVLKGSILA